MTNKTISRRDFLATTSVATAGVSLGTFPKLGANQEPERNVPRLPLKILARNLGAEYVSQIQAFSPQIQIVQTANADQWQHELPDAQVIYGGFSREDLRKAKKLQWIQWSAAGVERILFPELVNGDIILTNAKGCYAPEISEHVFGLLFGLTRGIASQVRQMREHKWGRTGHQIELRGLTMGIVGLGGIGRQTARRAKAMDMRVIAVDAEPMFQERFSMVDEVHLVDNWLPELLKNSDVVVSAAPHTKRSEGMFGANEFNAMKKTAYFINVSRGKLVKTPALVDALKQRQISGAGLDVTDPEPLPPDHELWNLPNVIITSHTAAQSQFNAARIQKLFLDNVQRYINNLPLLNVVDKIKGY